MVEGGLGYMSQTESKHTFRHVRPAETRIRAVPTVWLVSVVEEVMDPCLSTKRPVKTDQTELICPLIWVSLGALYTFSHCGSHVFVALFLMWTPQKMLGDRFYSLACCVKLSTDNILKYIFLIFSPENKVWHFMQIILGRQFACNAKPCFLGKKK